MAKRKGTLKYKSMPGAPQFFYCIIWWVVNFIVLGYGERGREIVCSVLFSPKDTTHAQTVQRIHMPKQPHFFFLDNNQSNNSNCKLGTIWVHTTCWMLYLYYLTQFSHKIGWKIIIGECTQWNWNKIKLDILWLIQRGKVSYPTPPVAFSCPARHKRWLRKCRAPSWHF